MTPATEPPASRGTLAAEITQGPVLEIDISERPREPAGNAGAGLDREHVRLGEHVPISGDPTPLRTESENTDAGEADGTTRTALGLDAPRTAPLEQRGPALGGEQARAPDAPGRLVDPPRENGMSPGQRKDAEVPETLHAVRSTNGLQGNVLTYLIQRELAALKFYLGPANGEMGPDLAVALHIYQKARGLEPDGVPTPDFLLRLAREHSEELRNKQHPLWPSRQSVRVLAKDLVKETQALLKSAGFDPGPLDGSMGPRTWLTVKDYQGTHGLEADGVITAGLLVHLQSIALERQAREAFARGRYKEAARLFTLLIQIRPNVADLHYDRGVSYERARLLG